MFADASFKHKTLHDKKVLAVVLLQLVGKIVGLDIPPCGKLLVMCKTNAVFLEINPME